MIIFILSKEKKKSNAFIEVQINVKCTSSNWTSWWHQ